MNKQLGKLLVLGGFGLRLFLNGINIIVSLLKIALYNSLLSDLMNFTHLCATTMIVAGFALIFFTEHDLSDLVLAGCFSTGLLSPVLSFMSEKVSFRFHNNVSALLGLTMMLAFIIWSLKLRRKSNPIAALAVIGSFAVIILAALISDKSYIRNLIFRTLIFASTAALTFAAFIEFNNDRS